MTKLVDLTELLAELNSAKLAHISAKKEISHARNNECSAINRLNAAQKAIDEWYAKQKAEADGDSDWARSKRLINTANGLLPS